MKYEIKYDIKLESLYITIFATLEEKDVHELMADVEKLYVGKPRRYALIDLSEAKGDFLDKSARRAFKVYAPKMEQGKIAVVGVKPVTRILIKAALVALGGSEMTRFFKKNDETLVWLKGEE